MELIQRPELRQKVTLSPQVYQGLAILAMPVAELRQLIEAELLENPLLDVEEYEDDSAEGEDERTEDPEEERAWDEWLDQYQDLDDIEPTAQKDPNIEKTNSDEFVGGVQTFDEYLLGQLGMLDIEEDIDRASRAIIGSLDGDGFFVGDCSEIAAITGVDGETAEAALRVVQQLDPPGVAAHNVREALRIQAAYLGLDNELLLAIIARYLDDIAANHFHKVARAERVSEDDVRAAVEQLRQLNPRPAGSFSPGQAPAYILPDVTLRRFGDDWLVISSNEAIPALRVNSRYRAMLRSDSNVDDETRTYLKAKVRAAESFMKNVDRRRDTVGRIAEIILDVQREFFEDGKGDLRPLRLEDVAVELSVHLSTVSRGVTGKYMATPYGLFELRHFFSGGYRTSTGVDVAATTVKRRIKDLIAEEDPLKPLSDQKLAEALAEDGVRVARRTVAKYREEMGIEPSWARKHR
ncbi:MAG: RNA polymerase factor sigma-54 [Coriobacteriia bacterium]|nr:RNA polymerase factor sigma-54 [Coriobacteriia bacterium]